jgi:hypothetical protein
VGSSRDVDRLPPWGLFQGPIVIEQRRGGSQWLDPHGGSPPSSRSGVEAGGPRLHWLSPQGLWADGSSRLLGPGDADVEAPGDVRSSENLGTENVVVYIQFGPPNGLPNTIWLTAP